MELTWDATQQKRAEESLAEERNLLRTLIDNLPDLISIKGPEGRYILDNLAHRQFVGAASPDEVIGKTVFDFYLKERAAEYAADDRAILQSGQPVFNREEQVVDRAGNRRWLSTTKIPLRDGQGEVLVTLSRDVTEHMRAEEMEERLRAIKTEMQVARRIQQKLFPEAAPPLPHIDLGGASYPAEATGGDYFDYLSMCHEGVGIVIGDVSGHGFGPALLMASARAHLRALAQTHTDVGQILTLANRVLAQDIEEDRFITLLLSRLDPGSRSLVYSNAGHPDGYVLDSRGEVRTRLQSQGPALGMTPDYDYPSSASLVLEPGEIVLLLTDGIIEAEVAEGNCFGSEHALEVVRANRSKPAQEIVAALYAAVCEFCGSQAQVDDITAVVLKVGTE